MFQYDNSLIHSSKNTLKWLKTNNISTIDWITRSSDINPAQNVWSLLVNEVYARGRQCETINGLKNSLLKGWNRISMDSVSSLIKSMTNRVFGLLIANGQRKSIKIEVIGFSKKSCFNLCKAYFW